MLDSQSLQWPCDIGMDKLVLGGLLEEPPRASKSSLDADIPRPAP